MMQTFKNYYHLCIAILANIWYGFPSRKLTMIGVTGTDGKTTTSSIIYQILDKSGYKAAMISTVGAFIGGKVHDVGFHVTTPSSFAIQRYLRQAVDQNITHVVLEVTSHALDQNRVWGIHFQVGVLTNITHEHLDYHQNYNNYVAAKAILFKHADVSIINADDESYTHIRNHLGKAVIISYGKGTTAGETFSTFPFRTNLIGEYNRYNALAAALAAREVGVPVISIQQCLEHIIPPKGRQEIVYNKEFSVMIDFAHTPNAFHVLLPELKQNTKGRIIHVFGAASKRDESKRPVMGKESATNTDIIILTAEDPRGESVRAISEQIAKGFTHWKEVREDYVPKKGEKHVYYIMEDRKKAIEKAICIAESKDLVLCTGKSHETSMNYGNGEESWDEYRVVEGAIKQRKIKKLSKNML